MNKKLLLTSALTLGILATGTVAYTSLSSAQEVQKDNVLKPSDSTEQNTPQKSETPSSELSKSETSDTLPSNT